MLKNQKPALSAKKSSRVQRRQQLINPLDFARLHGGSLRMKVVEGSHYFGFVSEEIKVHAWGNSFEKAYKNMLKNFHEKVDLLNSKAIA